MSKILDFLDNFVYGPMNYIDRFEGLVKSSIYWDTGYRFAILRLDKGGKHSLAEVSNLLQSYGIAIYCRTYDADNRYFRVKKRQAIWAEYLLLHAGVDLRSPLLDPRNLRYVTNHPSGWMPTSWRYADSQEKNKRSNTPPIDRNHATLEQKIASALQNLLR